MTQTAKFQLFNTGQAVEINPELGVGSKVRYVFGKQQGRYVENGGEE